MLYFTPTSIKPKINQEKRKKKEFIFLQFLGQPNRNQENERNHNTN